VPPVSSTHPRATRWNDRRDWTVHPGLHWAEEIAASGQTQASVAKAIGASPKHLNQVVRGWVLPSAALTLRFAEHCGIDARFLWRLQADYLMDLAMGKRDITHDD